MRDFHEKKSLTNLFDKIYNFKKKKNFSTPLVVKISPDIEKENISEIIEILKKFKILPETLPLPEDKIQEAEDRIRSYESCKNAVDSDQQNSILEKQILFEKARVEVLK